MDLTIDLSLDRRGGAGDAGDRRVGLHDLAGLAARPRELARLLWGRRWSTVTVLGDETPLSVVRAGGLGLAALARAGSFRVADGGGERAVSRPALLARAAGRLARAAAGEALRAPLLIRRAERVASRPVALPPAARGAGSAAYLRTEASLSWMGEYVGGAATHTTGVINGLVRNGLDVHVFASERPDGIDGARFTAVPVERVYHGVKWLTPVDYGRRVVETAARERPDFVYQRYSLGSTAGLELAARLGVPLVLEYNGSEIWIERNWGSTAAVRARRLGALEERNIADASLLVVVSDVLREELEERGVPAERILVNPNGVDVDALAPLRERSAAEWRRALGRADVPTIGFVGTFGLWHGVKELPAIAAALADDAPAARWVAIGDGPLRDEVRAELDRRGLADRFELPGVVPHSRALELLAACDVCVSPHVPNPDGTRFFGSPTKLFEYMGLRRPIVASDLEQIGEVIDDGRTGLLHAPGDAAGAAAAVARLLADEGLRDRLAGAALDEAAREYTWDAHVRRILERLAARAPVAAR